MSAPEIQNSERKFGYILLRIILPVIVVLFGLIAAKLLIDMAPKAERNPPVRNARMIDVITAVESTEQVTTEAMGVTKAAKQIDLEPQVGGRIISLDPSLEPGGYFSAGDQLLQIERKDYELVLSQRQSELKEAQSKVIEAKSRLIIAEKELKVEQGNQKVAQREFELLGQSIAEEDRELVLRVPQLLAAEAAVESSQAAIESANAALESSQAKLQEAELDLQRTSVLAPFNAVVIRKFVDLGDVVSSNTSLVTMVGTDQFWIEVAVPVSQLQWINIPGQQGSDTGSTVRIYNHTAWGEEVFRVGQITRLVAELDSQSRMAKVLVTIDDPLAFTSKNKGKPALLIGSYVRVEIEGPILTDVIKIPRSMVWDGSTVRIMNDSDQLEIRNIVPLYQARDFVLINGNINPGERIIATDISAAVEGLPLRTRDQSPDIQPETIQ